MTFEHCQCHWCSDAVVVNNVDHHILGSNYLLLAIAILHGRHVVKWICHCFTMCLVIITLFLCNSFHIWLAWDSSGMMVPTICISGVFPLHIEIHINKQSCIFFNEFASILLTDEMGDLSIDRTDLIWNYWEFADKNSQGKKELQDTTINIDLEAAHSWGSALPSWSWSQTSSITACFWQHSMRIAGHTLGL